MEGQDLNASEALVRAMVDSALDAVVGMDHEGRIIEFSRAAERMFGLSRVDAVGEPLGELLVPPSLRERHRHALARYLESGEARILGQRLELTALRADGREFPIELTVARLDLEGPPRFVGFIRDIAPLRRLEEERRDLDRSIQRAQRLESLGVLAGGIAHDFNNILVGVLGNAGLALDALPSSAPVRVFLERIKRAGQRAEQLADQLLAYSGKGLFVVVPLDLNDEIEQISDLLRSSISKKATLKLDLRADLPAIEGDVAQIGQVVMNLIINASEALGDESGVISVRTDVLEVDRADLQGFDFHRDDPKGRLVSLVVSDTGCGMDAETRDKIFEPFFTTKFTGRGLGLAATLGIVRGHAGAMRVTSSPGEGTTFEIVFPESTRRVEVARPLEPDEAAWTGSGVVLVVDDDEFVQILAADTLAKGGFEAVIAGDGVDALRIFRERAAEVAVVLLDLTMPNKDGHETFHDLRRIRPDVPVVLCSGYNEHEAIRRFPEEGLTGFLKKPYLPDDLLAAVRRALDGRPG